MPLSSQQPTTDTGKLPVYRRHSRFISSIACDLVKNVRAASYLGSPANIACYRTEWSRYKPVMVGPFQRLHSHSEYCAWLSSKCYYRDSKDRDRDRDRARARANGRPRYVSQQVNRLPERPSGSSRAELRTRGLSRHDLHQTGKLRARRSCPRSSFGVSFRFR